MAVAAGLARVGRAGRAERPEHDRGGGRGGPDGRLAAAWIQDGNVVGTLVGAPAVPLSAGGGASDLAIEMGVNGVAYAVWTQNGDVRAAQLRDATWTAVPAPLDVDPAAPATEPEVAVAADGSALVVWTEAGHVFARRIYGTTLSALPQDAGAGDSPQVDIEYDRSYAWVAFRQGTHSVARRLRASTFEAPYALDRGIDSGGPDVSMSSSGVGHGVGVTTTGWLVGAPLRNDVFRHGGPAGPHGRRDGRRAGDLGARRHGGRLAGRRRRPRPPAAGPRRHGRPGGARARRRGPAVGVVEPHRRRGGGLLRRRRRRRGHVRPTRRAPRRCATCPTWSAAACSCAGSPGQEFGGRQRYRVLVDGRRVGTTGGTSLRVRLGSGRHRIVVVGVDRRGQRSVAARRQIVTVR